MSDIIRQNYDQYTYIEIPKEVSLDSQLLENIKSWMSEAQSQSKKILFSPPPNFKIDPKKNASLFSFLKKDMTGKVLFVPQEGLQWSKSWRNILDLGFPVVEKHKGLLWANNKSIPSQIESVQLQDTFYLRCSGNLKDNLNEFVSQLSAILKKLPHESKIESSPQPIQWKDIVIWSYLRGALIIDVANVFFLNKKFFEALSSALEEKELDPTSPNIYFLTSGIFQSWLVKHGLGVDALNEVGNIVRVLPDNEKQYDDVIRNEVKTLAKTSSKQDPPIVLMAYQVKGAEQAFKTIQSFYPDIVIVDAISDANNLKGRLDENISQKVYHVTPSNDPGLLILGPQLISQGYDINLFAEYLISRYRNNRGSPNDTYIYYMNAQPEYLKKVTAFFGMEFDYILNEKQKAVLGSVSECEPEGDRQGNFVISLLQDKILKLDIELPLSMQGCASLLSRYPQLFPNHFSELCTPLRLFLRGDSSLKMIQTNLHLIHDYNELSLKQEGFWIESRFQENSSTLTIKSNADKSLEKRCFSLFALLNGSDVFHRLPDKEIFISLISMLWENYKHDFSHQSQGFLITLTTSPQASELKVFQSENNRIMLREEGDKDHSKVQFIADFPYYQGAQKDLLKLISHLFTKNPQDPKENAWRFACFEAIPQVVANFVGDQKIKLDLSIDGERWCAILASSAKETNTISDRSRKMFESGTDRNKISANGRCVTLIRNPFKDEPDITSEKEEVSLNQELENLQENKILQQVEDQKSKDAAERSARLSQIYEQALKSYNKKYGFEENEFELAGKQKKGGKTLEEAIRIKMIQRKQPDLSKRKKLRNIILGVSSFLVIVVVSTLIYLFTGEIKPTGEGLIIVDSNSSKYVPTNLPATSVTAQPNLPPDPARDLVDNICNLLNFGKALNHDQINELLKKLYFCDKEMKESGDLYNLIGRLFWYKVHIEQYEKYFSQDWIDRWKKEAKKAFESAHQKYTQNKFQSSFKILISNWQPEKRWYPETQGAIQYPSNSDAVKDIENVLIYIKK